jgi:hypothetical protein
MSNVPTIKQVARISVIPQLLLMGIFIYAFYLLNFENGMAKAALNMLNSSDNIKD